MRIKCDVMRVQHFVTGIIFYIMINLGTDIGIVRSTFACLPVFVVLFAMSRFKHDEVLDLAVLVVLWWLEGFFFARSIFDYESAWFAMGFLFYIVNMGFVIAIRNITQNNKEVSR